MWKTFPAGPAHNFIQLEEAVVWITEVVGCLQNADKIVLFAICHFWLASTQGGAGIPNHDGGKVHRKRGKICEAAYTSAVEGDRIQMKRSQIM